MRARIDYTKSIFLYFNFVQQHTPSIKSFTEYYENELYDAFDPDSVGKGDRAYQVARFLLGESLDAFIAPTTKWLQNADIQEAGLSSTGELSPQSNLRDLRKKRMREAIKDSIAPTVYTDSAIRINGQVGRELTLDSPDMPLRGTEEGSKYCTIDIKTNIMLNAIIFSVVIYFGLRSNCSGTAW